MTQSVATRKAAVNRFFARTPTKPNYTTEILLIVFGSFGVLAAIGVMAAAASSGGVSSVASSVCCGFVFAILGGAGAITGGVKYFSKSSAFKQAFDRAEPKPPASWIRELLRYDLYLIEQAALRTLGIDADDLQIEGELGRRLREVAITAGQINAADTTKHPVIIVGPARDTRIAEDNEHGRLLFERCEVTIICPTETQFSIYECILFLDTGRLGTEKTFQYPYSHVAAISTLTMPLARSRPNEVATSPEANFEVPLADMEFQFLQIQVTSGGTADISCGFVNQNDRTTSVSSFMPDFATVTEAVRAALRQRGAFLRRES